MLKLLAGHIFTLQPPAHREPAELLAEHHFRACVTAYLGYFKAGETHEEIRSAWVSPGCRVHCRAVVRPVQCVWFQKRSSGTVQPYQQDDAGDGAF
ncbi:unnamed protein product [Rangifer tarandus platyrhynchus]|uniref:Uncharacterized protein n=1 Tax=Rangifer tarandus platyrhynchus TaxID=3082113 RepID=A0AC59YCU4_RANTA